MKQKTIAFIKNMHSERFFKSAKKILSSSFPVILQTFFTWSELKRHLGTQRTLESHSMGTW